jgi:hypothetical protein
MSKKKYQDGGVVGNTNYPFGQGQAQSAPPASTGMTQTPAVEINTAGSESAQLSRPFGLKKGGSVKQHRGDGIAQRGRTKGRML